MEKYKNLSQQADEISFECGVNSITLIFNDKVLYHYSSKSMELKNVKHMCMLAKQGYGLRKFMNSKETKGLVKHEYKKTL